MQARISLDEYRRVVRAAYKVLDDPAFGLHMGERMSHASFDVLGHLVEHSSSLRGALQMAIRFSRIVSDGPRLALDEHGDVATIQVFLPERDTPESRLASEFSTVGLLRLVRLFIGDDALPRRVFFTHPVPAHHAEYARIFGASARFSQSITGMEIDRAWLDTRPSYHQSELRSYLLTRAEFLLAKATRAASATDRVRRWLEGRSELARPTLDVVARDLGTSVRSLRRRLQEERAQFSDLVEDARSMQAKRMLQEAPLQIQEAAHALGFVTASAFSRAFKRWTGMTPKAYRKASQPTPGDTSG